MKKTLLFILILILYLGSSGLYAQRVITGTVTTQEEGTTLPGVNVIAQGTTFGTTTDFNGKYSLEVNDEATRLDFSFIGYEIQSIEIGSQTVIDVVMVQSDLDLDEVVVTALGISKEKKSLAYSTQQLDNEDLTAVKSTNAINSLDGKVAGMFINKSASGAGGSSRIILRGNKSTRNNEPLIVVDGIPMMNYSPEQPGSVWGGSNADGSIGVDGGDALANINPDDIESISVLKGASAAALYGSEAANGAIMITTKKGTEGKGKLVFSSNFTIDQRIKGASPDLQFKYGQTSEGSLDSWGAALASEAPDHVDEFFGNGSTMMNSLSFSAGGKKAQTYLSYANTRSKGIMESNNFSRHNFDIKETASLFNGVLDLTASAKYLNQKVENSPALGLYFNPLTGLYFFPRGLDFNEYKNNYEVYNPERNLMAQNWIADKDDQQNPYWILNRNQNSLVRNRIIGSINLTFHVVKGLDIIARGNIDKTYDKFEQKSFATTQATIADANGRYVMRNTIGSQLYGDLLAHYQWQNKNWYVSANLGTSIRDQRVYQEYFDSFHADLRFANVFSLQNIQQPGATFQQSEVRSQLSSAYGSVTLGFKSMLYLDVTGRNDWSSTLPDNSFFYPSVGLSWVASEIINADWMDFLQLRVSYAVVGNGVAPYAANPINRINPITGFVEFVDVTPLPGVPLVPEKSKSFETGFSFRVLKDRINLDFTYYNNNTENQFVQIKAPDGSGYAYYLVNAGIIQNTGMEVMLEFVPVVNNNFKWSSIFNYTKNNNTVRELHDELPNGIYWLTEPGVNNYGMAITEGGSFGDIYGKKFKRADNGDIIVDAEGRPLAADGGLEYLGNPRPDFLLGWNNIFTIKNWDIRLLINARIGGKVMSITEAMNDLYGVSQTSAEARDNGGVDMAAQYEDGTPFQGKLDAQEFYTTVGGRAGITEHYMYDATNIRLAEFAFGYKFNLKSNVVSGLKLSFVSRNLFFFMNKAPFDPDISMSTATAMQGVEVYALPSTRSFGLNLILSLN